MSHFKTILLQVVICTYLFPLVCAQLSQPIFSDENIDTRGNKFLSRSVGDLRQPKEREEIDLFACPVNVELSWMTEVSSSVYSTPLITDLFSDGAKEIIVPSFVHYLETLEAADGAVASGWPAFHKSSTHASPLLTDIDYDGVQDISIATYDGEVLFFKDNGEEIPDRLYVPRLSVRKNWFKGLNPDHVDHSHPDVNDPNIGAEAALQDAKLRQARVHGVPAPTPAARKRRSSDVQEGAAKEEADQLAAPEQGPNNSSKTQEKPPEDAKGGSQEPADKGAEPGGGSRDQEPSGGSGADSKAGRRPQEEAEPKQPGQAEDAPKPSGTLPAVAAEEPESGLESGSNSSTTVSQQRRRLLDVTAASAENKAELDPEAEESFDVFKDTGDYEEQHLEPDYMDDGHMHDFPYDDDDYYMPFDDESKRRRWGKDFDDMDDMDDFWDDEDFMEGPHGNSPTHVMVDPHILCTPTIADLDGDGHDEMIISVSYFYDREHYDHSDHKMELGDDIDIANYVASGIVVYELHSRTIKWSQHLDLSTDFTKYRAYIYSSPTVADIDRDGSLEIIVGTSVGFLYVLDSKGEPREGWPVQMGEIQGQPLVADVNGDGFLEIFVGDTRGNSALFNYKGHELWERHVGGIIAQMATAGDINGDGELEIVFGTGSGDIHAVNGKTGQEVPNFPFRTGGRVMAPVLIVKLLEGTRAQHLVVSSFDGLLYMVDGLTGCADTIDVGETSYAMVLADDLNGNGRLDLVLSTMNGNVYRFETAAPYHPMKVWSSEKQGRNNFVARYGIEGVFATTASRVPRDVRGQNVNIRFEIVDNRPPALAPPASPGEEQKSLRGPYSVSVTLQGVGVEEMNMGDQPVIGMVDTYTAPGVYELSIPCPRTRSTATISIEMTDESKVLFTDSFSLSFHMHFYRLLKWMLILPFAMMAAIVLALPSGNEAVLPSYALRTHDA